MNMRYRAEYENDNFKNFEAEDDDMAFELAEKIKEHFGFEMLLNIFEIDEDYDEIRTIF